MAKMASLHAELTELPDEAKGYMQGFYRGREEGVEFERERIIKLLENKRAEYLGADDWADAAGMDDAIALIKGEN
ncbi:MAG: hypothetical protein EBR82_26075 [Caulobacteraceae bacterium]|nr:hypothetical protein [Caulobacteraceae bacterium]